MYNTQRSTWPSIECITKVWRARVQNYRSVVAKHITYSPVVIAKIAVRFVSTVILCVEFIWMEEIDDHTLAKKNLSLYHWLM